MRTIVLVLMAFTTAYTVHAQPSRSKTSLAKKTHVREMDQVRSKDGTRIAFSKEGQGPALVLVSGALSHRAMIDTALVKKLAEHFTVYTYDRRGRGESGDTKPYAVDREIEDLESVIDHAGGKALIFGVSSGAALSLQAAKQLGPDKVLKLALYEPPFGQPKDAYDKQKQQINEIVRSGEPGDAAEFFLSSIGMPPEALEGMKKSPQWDAMKKMDFTLAYDYEVLGDGMVPEATAKAITIPTLVLVGEKSMQFMHTTAESLADLILNGQRLTLKGQTHTVSADVVAPILTEFFAKAE